MSTLEDRTEELEVLKTQDMIEESFFKNLRKAGGKISVKIDDIPEVKETPLPTNTEELMLNLYEVRDGLIAYFEQTGLKSQAKGLATHINKLGDCIKKIGGEVDIFDPLEHVSGLQAPDINKSAEKVIDTTKQCYTLGKITDTKVENEGKTISIQFEGEEGDIVYKAKGIITASSSWKGNEAIDYIYTEGSGVMSVKAFENNKWQNNHKDYDISWELVEIPKNELENFSKEEEKKEEIIQEAQNNQEEEEIGDFPIQEN